MLDGDALSEAQMQAIAKQAGFSECAFVCRSDKADLRLRFFMPLQETVRSRDGRLDLRADGAGCALEREE